MDAYVMSLRAMSMMEPISAALGARCQPGAAHPVRITSHPLSTHSTPLLVEVTALFRIRIMPHRPLPVVQPDSMFERGDDARR